MSGNSPYQNDTEAGGESLVDALNDAGRKLGTAGVLFHQAIAEQAGLGGSDHKYLDLLVQHGPMPAGRLAELTGLTTGAVTGVVDRLERKGLVHREPHPDDRRRIILRPDVDRAMELLAPLFEPMSEDLRRLASEYTEDEKMAIIDYMERCAQMMTRYAQSMRGENPNSRS